MFCRRLLAVGAASLSLFTACTKPPQQSRTEVFEKAYEVDPNARLTIRNLRGSISIQGVDSAELRIKATKTGDDEAQLNSMNITVEAEPGSVSIATSVVPQKKNAFRGDHGSVDYILTVPRTVRITRLELDDGNVLIEGMEGDDVRANVVDGKLTVRDCCGNLHLGIANGDLDLSYEHCARRVFVAEAQITHGNARVLVPRDAAFRVRAETDTGSIANDFTDIVQVNGRSVPKIDMVIGSDARSELSVRVTLGDIKIAATPASLKAGPTTAASGGSQ